MGCVTSFRPKLNRYSGENSQIPHKHFASRRDSLKPADFQGFCSWLWKNEAREESSKEDSSPCFSVCGFPGKPRFLGFAAKFGKNNKWQNLATRAKWSKDLWRFDVRCFLEGHNHGSHTRRGARGPGTRGQLGKSLVFWTQSNSLMQAALLGTAVLDIVLGTVLGV